MTFKEGDAVHVKAIGKGIVREVRNNGRYLVEVGGRSIVTTFDQLTAQELPRKKPVPAPSRRVPVYEPQSEAVMSIDLHGRTVEEALEAVASFLNDALLRGAAEVHVIHGRSGGRIKASLHAQLKRIATVRSFALDPRNPGVTIVKL